MRLTWPRRAAPVPTLRRHRRSGRRWLSAGLLAAACAAGLPLLAPAPPRTVPVLVAAHDLAAGGRIEAGDLAVARWAPGTGPRTPVADPGAVVGRVVAGPIPRGAPVTDAGLLGPGLLTGQAPDLRAVPVRLGDSTDRAGSSLVRRGDRIDLVSALTGLAVVSDVVVLATPVPADSLDDGGIGGGSGAGSVAGSGAGSGAGAGGELVVAVTATQTGQLATAQARGPLTVAVRRG